MPPAAARHNSSTEELQALDARHHMHPFTDGDALAARGARIIERAEGVYLYDSDGVEILDGMAGLWCVNVGYGRTELADAAARQMRALPYYNLFFQSAHPPAIALAERLAALAPAHVNHVHFAGSGSEANDTNIRMARTYWAAKGEPERRVIIARKNAYHGSTMGGASLGGMAFMHAQGGLPIPDIHHIDQPYWWAEGGDETPEAFGVRRAQALAEAIERIGPGRVAAFIAEPVQGAGGVVIPPETYWPEIRRICDEYGILLILDEVITGFGRLGTWFGAERYDLKPDLMTIAKALTSGYLPMGGTLVSDRVAEVINGLGDEFAHGYTFAGHPVAAAVALENIRILDEEGVVDRAAQETGPYLRSRWAELVDHPLVGEARMVGMMGALELSPDKASRAAFAAPTGTVGAICRDVSVGEARLVMRAVRDGMILSPPLTIARDEIDVLIERAWRALDLTHARLKAEGLMRARAAQ